MHSEGSFEGSDYPQKASVREARNPPGTLIFRQSGWPIINFPERRFVGAWQLEDGLHNRSRASTSTSYCAVSAMRLYVFRRRIIL